jgi:meso-butanediol dehydrogenase/(S,S)-butanediol dehydrogenase/diacetyl reductase
MDTASAKAVADEVRAIGRTSIVTRTDVADREQVFAAVEEATRELGGFDIMVNNAGIAQVQTIEDVRPGDVERIVRINIGGVLWGIQAAAAKLRELGHGGKIIAWRSDGPRPPRTWRASSPILPGSIPTI